MRALQGKATQEGTAGYAGRHAGRVHPDHFRRSPLGLMLSSIGLGTYLGEADEATDRAYAMTVEEALRSGIHVLDAAINYRHQRSERSLGRALAESVAAGDVARDEVVVTTKGGYLAFDGAAPADPPRWFERTFVDSGILEPRDLAAGCHAMAPAFLEDQLGRSLANLGLACVDVYYVHNPEAQLPEVGRPEFLRRIRLAFEHLEGEADRGRIGVYGVATWSGFRARPGSDDSLSLRELLEAARVAGGVQHRFRVVQLPLNVAMREAAAFANQEGQRGSVPFLEAAREAGITVMTSGSILQGRLAAAIPRSVAKALAGLRTPAQKALQFARSAPGVSTALIGMKSPAHLGENLEVARVPRLEEERFRELCELAGGA